MRVRTRLTTKPGDPGHDAALAQLLADVPRRRDRLVGGLVVADDLDERQHRDGVEEVEADVGADLRHRERRRVRGEDGARRKLAQLREHLLLDVQLLDDRLEHEVALLEPVPARRSRHERRALTDLPADVGKRSLHELVAQVADHERHLESLQEERCQLTRHQAGADDSDLLDLPRLCVGNADALLLPSLDEVERVDRVLGLRLGQQRGDRVLLGAGTRPRATRSRHPRSGRGHLRRAGGPHQPP